MPNPLSNQLTASTRSGPPTDRYESAQERDERLAWEEAQGRLGSPLTGTQRDHSLYRSNRAETSEDWNDPSDPWSDDDSQADPTQAGFYNINDEDATYNRGQARASRSPPLDRGYRASALYPHFAEREEDDDYGEGEDDYRGAEDDYRGEEDACGGDEDDYGGNADDYLNNTQSQAHLAPTRSLPNGVESQSARSLRFLPIPVEPPVNQSIDPLFHLPLLEGRTIPPLPTTLRFQHPHSLVYSQPYQGHQSSQAEQLERVQGAEGEDDEMDF
ncbi:hypothetical protein M231_03283 [Tremella mesenterica]|uniref:Uncharacterized protein n=1 Tax=Tremella mesenterica TaxID=5217 RepID=A0A4Q1BNV3_TREME|nr:hypothetical protein M231_03283 [Tremella mesenterica]